VQAIGMDSPVARPMASLPQLTMAPATDWQLQGECRAADSGVFFPPSTFEPKAERELREAKAKAICAGCLVRTECLDWALSTREPHGVWGGYSELERKQILHGKRQAS
jgi:WhiB family transcriptional regulator, redox-sensing transcriptional regulator